MSNQVVVDSLPFILRTAQEQVLRTYQRLVEARSPRDFKLIIKEMGENPLYSLILSEGDTLAKAALLSGINAYVRLGDSLNTSNFKRMNLAVSLDLLETVAGFPADLRAQARVAGHTQLIIMAKTR